MKSDLSCECCAVVAAAWLLVACRELVVGWFEPPQLYDSTRQLVPRIH